MDALPGIQRRRKRSPGWLPASIAGLPLHLSEKTPAALHRPHVEGKTWGDTKLGQGVSSRSGIQAESEWQSVQN
jgi:hypothetical protein